VIGLIFLKDRLIFCDLEFTVQIFQADEKSMLKTASIKVAGFIVF